jgi:hypothetical protein
VCDQNPILAAIVFVIMDDNVGVYKLRKKPEIKAILRFGDTSGMQIIGKYLP